jgi:AcrR family transcriptional regulator
MSRLETKTRGEAAEHLKRVARRLFAERGVDGVSVREIAEAAGQKNHGAVGYYFGSKDALVRELVADGARLIDERRNAWLDRIEAGGGPQSVLEVVEAFVYPSVGLEPEGREDSYTRFIVMLGMTHRQTFMEALEGRWNSGYLRCLEHLRKLMPPMSPAAKNQRFVFLGGYLGAVLAAREAALTDPSRPHPTWSSDQTLAHLVQTAAALLLAPAPPEGEGAAAGDPGVVGPLGAMRP